MENKTIQNTLPESWFIDRIGKYIIAKSENFFNGKMEIKDESHAKYLCHTAQVHFAYTFSDVNNPKN